MTEEHVHIVPYKTFLIIWFALLILTGITIAVAQYNLGALNIWVALGIATLKAGLVVAVFMHMQYESYLFKLSLLSALAILAIFIGFTFFDVLYR
ncbi:MAG: cytochrome C oxidase subunit IV family protein [Desulfuromonadales bacterium]|nr:cytochrome C oxidase subunit IV family protein [Desulfuromonadales bacterium]